MEAFKEITDFDGKCKRAVQIYEKYLQPYAQFQINIDQDQVQAILTTINRITPSGVHQSPRIRLRQSPAVTPVFQKLPSFSDSPENNQTLDDLFNDAQSSCLKLMKYGSFLRFKRSQEWKDMIQFIQREKAIKENLETTKILVHPTTTEKEAKHKTNLQETET